MPSTVSTDAWVVTMDVGRGRALLHADEAEIAREQRKHVARFA